MKTPDHHHYVITEDLFPIMRDWGRKHRFTIPEQKWFARNHLLLRSTVEKAINNVAENAIIIDSLPCCYITSQIKKNIYSMESQESFGVDLGSVVSLDKVYTLEINDVFGAVLEVNRVVDYLGDDLPRNTRPNSSSLAEQIKSFKDVITSKNIIVVDDGIWTGSTMKWVVGALHEQGLRVAGIVVGIMHKEPGALIDYGVPENKIFAVQQYYSYERPLCDWVCERDFFPGVPFGGRTVVCDSLPGHFSVGAYYIDRPVWLKKWASIDQTDGSMKKFGYQRSLCLFQEIERLSERSVLVSDLDRLPIKLALSNPDPTYQFCDFLKKESEID